MKPKRLFKYVGEDAAKIFEAGRILFRRPKYLNDPFDFAPRFSAPDDEYVEKQAKEIALQKYAFAKNPRPWPLFWKKCRAGFIEQLKAHWHEFLPNAGFRLQELFDISVLCLSEAENDLLLWAHYANGHKGFLMEFNSEDSFFARARLFKVEYQATRPVMRLDESNESKTNCVIVKGIEWKHEKEWRMFKNWQMAPDKYRDEGGLFDIPGSAFRGVVLGYRATSELRTTLTAHFKKRDYQHIELRRAQPSSTQFKLDYVQL